METYVDEKLRVLKQLGIEVGIRQERHMRTLKTEIAVDNYAHDLIVGVIPREPIYR